MHNGVWHGIILCAVVSAVMKIMMLGAMHFVINVRSKIVAPKSEANAKLLTSGDTM